MKSNQTILKFVVSAVALATLAACGGGGGGGSSKSDPLENSDTTVSEVPASTYTAGTHIAQAYDYLNAQRKACGFGLLAQDTRLDNAAQNHADYLRINNLAPTHFEDQAAYPTGFTGVMPTDRMTSAGYPLALGSENIGGARVDYGTTFGQASIMQLFNAPYHGYGQLRGDRDVGFGFSQTGGDPNTNLLVVNFGLKANTSRQDFATGEVKTYPCEGSTGLLSQTYSDESPRPIAGRDLQTDPIGTPIYFRVNEADTLVVSTFDIRKSGSSTPVAAEQLNKATDANNILQDNSFVAFMPLSPLDKNASYVVSAAGTVNGKPFTKSFTFATGAF